MIEHNKITTNRDPANGTTVPNVGIAAARPKLRDKRATLAAAVVSAGFNAVRVGTGRRDRPSHPRPLADPTAGTSPR